MAIRYRRHVVLLSGQILTDDEDRDDERMSEDNAMLARGRGVFVLCSKRPMRFDLVPVTQVERVYYEPVL